MDSLERLKIREFLDALTALEIRSSFCQGLREADEGKAIEMEEQYFDNPTA